MVKKLTTKEKILKTASNVFAVNGYRETTIRMISEKADVNVASVNYYFGDKENLYMEVIRYWARDAFRDFPETEIADRGKPAEERISLFIYNTLLCLLGKDGKGTGFGRLMALEASISPSDMVHEVVRETIQKPTAYLREAVADLSGAEDDETLEIYTACIVGQTVYFYLSKNLIQDLFGIQQIRNTDDISRLSRSICAFSIAALKTKNG